MSGEDARARTDDNPVAPANMPPFDPEAFARAQWYFRGWSDGRAGRQYGEGPDGPREVRRPGQVGEGSDG